MHPYENLIAVTDRSLCSGDFLAQIKKIVSLHPHSLILRERDLTDEEYLLLARQVQAICEKEADVKVPFFVHSRIGIARQIGCPNLHMHLPALAALGIRPEGFACVSTSILGTIFETECKKGLRGRGLAFVEEICSACPVPVYAIGGIKESNIDAVMAAGAAGGCMMSGFMKKQ